MEDCSNQSRPTNKMAICKSLIRKYDIAIHRDIVSYYIFYTLIENKRAFHSLPMNVSSDDEADRYVGKYIMSKLEKK
jgi:hypothetical protein